MTWNFRYAPAGDGCRFTQFRVNVTGKITLPRWAGENGSSALAAKWRAFVAALRVHENGHYAHGISAADEIRAVGQSFRIPGRCSNISSLFDERATKILDKYRAADVAYDLATRHGRTQGVVFP